MILRILVNRSHMRSMCSAHLCASHDWHLATSYASAKEPVFGSHIQANIWQTRIGQQRISHITWNYIEPMTSNSTCKVPPASSIRLGHRFASRRTMTLIFSPGKLEKSIRCVNAANLCWKKNAINFLSKCQFYPFLLLLLSVLFSFSDFFFYESSI